MYNLIFFNDTATTEIYTLSLHDALPISTRFYRSEGEAAVQRTRIVLHEGSRLEWLPLEAICYSGCIAQNHLTLDRKSTRLNSSHGYISYAVFCLKKKKKYKSDSYAHSCV